MGPNKEKILGLEKKMLTLGIKKEDIEEKFIKSSGRGGQKLNKSNSAVFLKHKKTNLTVKCGKARSQCLNRFLALRTLVEKIEALKNGLVEIEKIKIDRIKRQKLKRKSRAKRKLSTGE